jgi:hypothetical protein
MMQHNALPLTALQDGAAKAARNKLQNALKASLLFHSPPLCALLCSTPCCVPARQQQIYQIQLPNDISCGIQFRQFGIGQQKGQTQEQGKGTSSCETGSQEEDRGCDKVNQRGEDTQGGQTEGRKEGGAKKRHQREQLKNQEKDEAEALAAVMEEEEEKEDEEEEEEEDLLGDRPKVVKRRNQSKKHGQMSACTKRPRCLLKYLDWLFPKIGR